LEKQPQRRYSSARELAEDLGRFLNYEPIHARPISSLRRVGQWVRRRPWAVTAAAVASVLTVLCVAYGLWAGIRERDWKIAYLEAQVARRDHAPAAEQVLARLREAARIRPDPRLYEEALEVLLVEGRAGQRIFPKPDWETNLLLPNAAQYAEDARELRPLRLTADGRSLVAGGVVFNVASGRGVPLPVPKHTERACDPQGQLMADTDDNGIIKVWDRVTGKERKTIDPHHPHRLLGFTSDSKKLVLIDTSQRTQDQIELWDLLGDNPPTTIPGQGHSILKNVVFSGDSRLLTCHFDKEDCITIHSVDTGAKVRTVALPAVSTRNTFALSQDGTHLAWVGYNAPSTKVTTMEIVDLATGEVVRRLLCPSWVERLERLAYTSDGKFVLGEACVSHQEFRGDGLFHHGEHVVVRPVPERVLIWEAETGNLALWLPGHTFAKGAGPQDTIVIAGDRGTKEDPQLVIDLWRPTELLSRLTETGLASSIQAVLPWEEDPGWDKRVEPDGTIVERGFLGFRRRTMTLLVAAAG
jgi:hypothetical protein